MGIAIVLIYTLVVNVSRIWTQESQYAELEERKDALAQEKKDLENEIQSLSDEDYVVRYARDHYIFSKDGEEVVKLPIPEE